jgi:hypothetical protein
MICLKKILLGIILWTNTSWISGAAEAQTNNTQTIEVAAPKNGMQKSIFEQIFPTKALEDLVCSYLPDYEKTQEIILPQNQIIKRACVTKNGNYIAIVDSTGNIIIYKVLNNSYEQHQIIPIMPPDEFDVYRSIHGIALSPDGSYLAITITRPCPINVNPVGYFDPRYTNLQIFKLQDNMYQKIQDIPCEQAESLFFFIKNNDLYISVQANLNILIFKLIEKNYKQAGHFTTYNHVQIHDCNGDLMVSTKTGISIVLLPHLQIKNAINNEDNLFKVSVHGNYIAAVRGSFDMMRDPHKKLSLVIWQILNNETKQIAMLELPPQLWIHDITLFEDKYVAIDIEKTINNKPESEILFYEIDYTARTLKPLTPINDDVALVTVFKNGNKLLTGRKYHRTLITGYSKLAIWERQPLLIQKNNIQLKSN